MLEAVGDSCERSCVVHVELVASCRELSAHSEYTEQAPGESCHCLLLSRESSGLGLDLAPNHLHLWEMHSITVNNIIVTEPQRGGPVFAGPHHRPED